MAVIAPLQDFTFRPGAWDLGPGGAAGRLCFTQRERRQVLEEQPFHLHVRTQAESLDRPFFLRPPPLLSVLPVGPDRKHCSVLAVCGLRSAPRILRRPVLGILRSPGATGCVPGPVPPALGAGGRRPAVRFGRGAREGGERLPVVGRDCEPED